MSLQYHASYLSMLHFSQHFRHFAELRRTSPGRQFAVQHTTRCQNKHIDIGRITSRHTCTDMRLLRISGDENYISPHEVTGRLSPQKIERKSAHHRLSHYLY